MEVRLDIVLIIAGAALVTLIPRIVPLMVLSRFKLPDMALRWLNYVPVSVMAALVAQELLLSNGKLALTADNVSLLAAVPTFWVAFRTRSLLSTVLVGILAVMLLRLLV